MKKILLIVLLALAGAFGFAASASAQDATCDNLIWSAEILASNPNIGDYCLDVVDKGGQQSAKLHARVVRQSVNSTIVQWQKPDGSWSPSERRYPDRGFRASIGDSDVKIMDLPERQEVNIYVPAEGNWTLPVAAAAPLAAAPEPEPVAEPEPEPEPVVLPTTATQIPLLALLGGLFILLGGALSLVRTRL